MSKQILNIRDYQADNNNIIGFYSRLLEEHKFSPLALDWGNRQSQELRFGILSQINSLQDNSLLDVGCGLGDLLDYLQKHKINVDYTGYDITPAMIEKARQRFPYAQLEVKDLITEPDIKPLFDYVLASGIFYLRLEEPIAYLEAIVRRMFSLCRKGVAFNTLSSLAQQKNLNEFYAEPAQVLTICQKITSRVVIRHDYLPHDFTVYLYKE